MKIHDAASAFGALSQETRLEILRLILAQGPNGLPAGDLSARMNVPPSTLSFHLAVLERAGLTQSTRQGRQIIHAVRIIGLRGLLGFLTDTCCGGRPELCGDLTQLPSPPQDEPNRMTPAFNVLFLCTHNSARSVMAEAILKSIGGSRFHAYSAGSAPVDAPNPEVLTKLQAFGHETDELHSKSWTEFTGANGPRMDFVITLCDMPANGACPDFGTLPVTAAWPLPDPAKFTGSPVERSALLNELYAGLNRRIGIFAALPFATLDRLAIQRRLDEIGGAVVLAR